VNRLVTALVPGIVSIILVISSFGVARAQPTVVSQNTPNNTINRMSPEESLSLETLTLESDTIAIGRVSKIRSYWSNEHNRIYTSASVVLERNIKSKALSPIIEITFPGGEIDGMGQWVSDMPMLRQEARAVFFLDLLETEEIPNVAQLKELPELYTIHGGFRGNLPIVNEKVGQLPVEDLENRVQAILSGTPLTPVELDIPLAEVTRPYSFSGQSWPHPPSPNVNYRINENSSDCIGEGAAVQAAASTWNAAGAFFSFSYGGACGATQSTQNYVNEITWTDLGSGGTVALTSYWYIPSSGQIVECDMEFNTYYTWSTSATPPSNCMDVQTVALHEFGHFLCLEDLYNASDNSKVMYGYVANGQARRSLHTDDIAGIKSIYGPLVPTVNNGIGASSIGGTTARLNGDLTSTGGQNPSVSIYYGTADGGTTAGNWQKHADLATIAAGNFLADVSALAPGTRYYYRCYAANSAGGVWASDSATFSTLVILPSLNNVTGATNIGPTAARLNGQLSSTGGNNPVVYIYYGQTDGGSVQSNWQHNINFGTRSEGTFYSDADSLIPDTTYYYRGYAVNTAGGAWASQSSTFSTSEALPPELVSNNATSITIKSVVLNGRLINFGTSSSVQVYFQWGVTDNYTETTQPLELSELASFSANITGLNPGTMYHFRAVASGGSMGYGEDVSFQTTPVPTFAEITDTQGNWYNKTPIITNLGFSDVEGLDCGWYQIDSFEGTWSLLYSSCNSTTWNTSDWAIPNFDILNEGTHTVYFKASNDDEEVGGTSGEWGWTFKKDTVSPLSVDNAKSSTHVTGIWSREKVIGISWDTATDNGSGIAGYSVLWDTSSTTEPDETLDLGNISSVNSTSMADGNGYYFHIRPVDRAGNLGTAKHIGPFSIDTAAPNGPTDLASITHTTGIWSANNNVAVTWDQATDTASGLKGYSILWDNSPVTTPSKIINTNNATSDMDAILEDGIYYFHIMAVDSAGNWASPLHLGPFMIDGYSPILSDGSVTPVSGFTSDEFVFSVSYRHPGGQAPGPVSVSIDGGVSSNMTWTDGHSGNFTEAQVYTYRVRFPSAGSHTYAFLATDNNSNLALGDILVHPGPTVSVQPTAPPSGGFGGGGFGGGGVVAGPGETNLSLYTNYEGVFVIAAYAESEDKFVRIDFAKGSKAGTKEGDPLKLIKIVSLSENYETDNGYILLSRPYNISPTGATFAPAVTMTMFYDSLALSSNIDKNSISIALYDPSTSQWQILGGHKDNSLSSLSTQITDVGIYALLGKNQPAPTLIKRSLPAQFSISDTLVDPISAAPGKTIQIRTKVSNTGGMAGEYTVTLKINGNVESSKTVEIDAGGSTELIWSIMKYDAGDYSVDINGSTASFMIIGPQTTIEPKQALHEPLDNKNSINWLITGATISLVVAAGFGTFLFRKRASSR
jgi:hypothetical protein